MGEEQDFREQVTRVGQKALDIVDEYFDGKRDGTDKIREATRMVGAAIKIEHMNQIRDFSKKSLALRLIKHLPKDEQTRMEYVKLTNPEIKPLLLARPEEK